MIKQLLLFLSLFVLHNNVYSAGKEILGPFSLSAYNDCNSIAANLQTYLSARYWVGSINLGDHYRNMDEVRVFPGESEGHAGFFVVRVSKIESQRYSNNFTHSEQLEFYRFTDKESALKDTVYAKIEKPVGLDKTIYVTVNNSQITKSPAYQRSIIVSASFEPEVELQENAFTQKPPISREKVEYKILVGGNSSASPVDFINAYSKVIGRTFKQVAEETLKGLASNPTTGQLYPNSVESLANLLKSLNACLDRLPKADTKVRKVIHEIKAEISHIKSTTAAVEDCLSDACKTNLGTGSRAGGAKKTKEVSVAK